MKDRKRPKLIALIKHDRMNLSGNAGVCAQSTFCSIDSVPYRIEYTEKGIKLCVIN